MAAQVSHSSLTTPLAHSISTFNAPATPDRQTPDPSPRHLVNSHPHSQQQQQQQHASPPQTTVLPPISHLEYYESSRMHPQLSTHHPPLPPSVQMTSPHHSKAMSVDYDRAGGFPNYAYTSQATPPPMQYYIPVSRKSTVSQLSPPSGQAQAQAPAPVPVPPPPPPPPPSRYSYQPVGLGIYEMQKYPGEYQPMLQAGKDIKRRTKTGCLTCRKRRIKCDEQHPTCNNCEKSRRICLGYDPLFHISADKKQGRRQSSMICVSKRPNSSYGSSLPAQVNHHHLFGSDTGNSSSSDGDKNNQSAKMRIHSLIHAAQIIDHKTEISGVPEDVVVKQEQEDEEKGLSCNLPPKVKQELQFGQEHWSNVCGFFTNQVAPSLDYLFGTERFGPMCLNLKKSCTTSNQDTAVVEAVRRLVATFSASSQSLQSYLEDIKDQKLEELRISNDYKLVRATVQMLAVTSESALLPCGEPDTKVYTRILVLNRLIHGAAYSSGVTTELTPLHQCNQGFATGLPTDHVGDLLADPSTLNKIDNVWRLLKYVIRGGHFTPEQLEYFASTVVSALSTAEHHQANRCLVVIGLLYYVHYHQIAEFGSRIRMRLLDQATDDYVIARLVKLCLHPVSDRAD